MADNDKSTSSSKVTVVMRANAQGFEPGEKVRVDQETADFLTSNGHADPAS